MHTVLMTLVFSLIPLMFGCRSWSLEGNGGREGAVVVSFPLEKYPIKSKSNTNSLPPKEKKVIIPRPPSGGHKTDGVPVSREVEIKMEKQEIERRKEKYERGKQKRKEKSAHRKEVEKIDRQKQKEVEKIDRQKQKEVESLNK